jgi:hypothetical protein
MSRSSTVKHTWLANQISTARRNLSEWPDWMKDAARFEGASKNVGQTTVSGRMAASQRTRKPK